MAGIKQPLQDILTVLSGIPVVNNDGNTTTMHARIWNNQIDRELEGDSYVYPKPACFVEVVSPAVFEQLGQGYVTSDLGIVVHLVHEYYNQDGTFDQDLLVFDLRDKIMQYLALYKPTGCSQLTYTGEQQDYDHSNIYHYLLSFTCNFIDSNASPYAPGRGVYVEKEPPTGIDMQVEYSEQPIFNPIQQPYKIPQ